MTRLSDDWDPAVRRLALVLAAAHDLGKLVTYRRVSAADWMGSPATPHDSLSATLLRQCPGFTALGPPDHREALLLACFHYHDPESLPSNAAPLARWLMAALIEADRQAIEAAANHDPVETGHTDGA
jgi:hypothetical protein